MAIIASRSIDTLFGMPLTVYSLTRLVEYIGWVESIAGENHQSNRKILVQSNQIIFLHDCNQITHCHL